MEGVAQGEGRGIGEKAVDKEVVQRWKSYKYTDERTVRQSWRQEHGKTRVVNF